MPQAASDKARGAFARSVVKQRFSITPGCPAGICIFSDVPVYILHAAQQKTSSVSLSLADNYSLADRIRRTMPKFQTSIIILPVMLRLNLKVNPSIVFIFSKLIQHIHLTALLACKNSLKASLSVFFFQYFS